jgi:hypothetical protein
LASTGGARGLETAPPAAYLARVELASGTRT